MIMIRCAMICPLDIILHVCNIIPQETIYHSYCAQFTIWGEPKAPGIQYCRRDPDYEVWLLHHETLHVRCDGTGLLSGSRRQLHPCFPNPLFLMHFFLSYATLPVIEHRPWQSSGLEDEFRLKEWVIFRVYVILPEAINHSSCLNHL